MCPSKGEITAEGLAVEGLTMGAKLLANYEVSKEVVAGSTRTVRSLSLTSVVLLRDPHPFNSELIHMDNSMLPSECERTVAMSCLNEEILSEDGG